MQSTKQPSFFFSFRYAGPAKSRAFQNWLWPLACCLSLFAFCLPASAQVKVELIDGKPAPASELKFGYKFENQRFLISLIEIDLDARGEGLVKFKRGETDEIIDLKLKVLPETLARIRQLYADTRFLDTEENYQDKTDHSNLGWVTLSANDGQRQRQARFNYTPNEAIKELADVYRGLATQQIHLFDLENAQQYQPLDVPRLLETLENDLKQAWIAEPAAVVTALRDIAGNDTSPLIARNHAKRIIDSIQKGKFKSPMNVKK